MLPRFTRSGQRHFRRISLRTCRRQSRHLSRSSFRSESLGSRGSSMWEFGPLGLMIGLPAVAWVTGFTTYNDAARKEKEEKEKKEKEKEEAKKKKKEKSTEEKKKEPKINFEKPQLELLQSERIVLLEGSINDTSANQIVCKLLLLDKVEKKPIHLYINSPGGKVTSGLAIYDAMQTVKSPVHTYVIGRASSMAAVIAASGEPGHRNGYENCRVMVHEASNGIPTKQVSDIILRTQETIYQNEVLLKLLSVHTKKTLEFCREHVRRDKYMSAEEAVEFGIFDQTIKTTSKL